MSEEKNISENSAEANSDLINQETTISESSLVNNEELSSIEESKTFQNKMEVHHHPDLHHKPKPWKEYFLEFLMIFLAVTLGFFAENIREHFVERKKEIETIVTFKNELQKDTAILTSLINVYTPAHNLWTDSAITLINANNLKGNEKNIFKVITNATAWQLYSTPEIAMNILKNSGYFNLIENTELKKEILAYDVIIKNYSNYSNFISSVQHTVDTSTLSFFKLNDVIKSIDKQYQASLKDGQFFISDKDISDSVLFRTYDKTIFLTFASRLEQVTQLLNDINSHYHFIKDQEVKLLNSINKEYPE